MSLQFSRSLRSLRVDSFRAARIGLLLALLLMAGLLAWFFLARVTLYENSTSLELNPDNRIVAHFSEEGLARLRVGQAAVVRLDLGSDQPSVTLPAFIYDLPSDSDQAVLVLASNETPPVPTSGKISGRVQVEVEYLTPVQLVLRATGKYLNESEIPLSPQTVQPAPVQGSP